MFFKWLERLFNPPKKKVKKRIKRTTPADRELFRQLYAEGYTGMQIANRTGFSEATVYNHLPPIVNTKKEGLFS